MTTKETVFRALCCNTFVGQEGFTKHDIFIWTQQIDSSISDGENVGRSISSLVYEGLIEVINPGHKPVKFRRIK